MRYDVVIIGGGVTGTAAARELSRYKAKVCVVEREEDVKTGRLNDRMAVELLILRFSA